MKLGSVVKNAFATKPGWATSSSERMSYYSYFAGQNMIYTLFNTCLATYLLFLGIDPIKSAAVIFAVKVWDAVNDTLFGVIFDKIRFRSGKKYLPWLRVSTVLIHITTILTFIIPSSTSETVKLWWFAISYLLWDTAYTLCDVPIFGILTSMTHSVDERNSIQSYKSIATYAGVFVTSGLATFLISEKVGVGYNVITVIISAMAFALMMPASFKLKERYSAEAEETFTLRRMFSYLFKNKYLLIYYVGYFFYAAANISAALSLLVSYYLFNDTLFSLVVGACGTVPSLICSLLVPAMLKKIDKMKLYKLCAIAMVVLSVVMWLIGYNNIILHIVLYVIRSIPLAIIGVLMFIFTPDCAEYGKYKSGIEAKGITFAIQTFMSKLTGAVSGALSLFLLGLKSTGWIDVEAQSFEELQQLGVVQSDHALSVLWFSYVMVPAIGCLIAYVIWNFYKLNDKDVQIMADCNAGNISHDEAEQLLSRKY